MKMKKSVFITGADRGLGLAFVKVFLQEDYHVFAGQFMPDWQELSELKSHYREELDIVSLDVTNQESVDAASNFVKDKDGQLDILINNAALFQDRSEDIFGELHFDDMKKIYDTNVLGPLRISHSLAPLLLKGDGKMLVNISSEAGSISDAYRKQEYGYCMSKAALNMQGKILQNHLQEYGIKVLSIHPGYVKSYMLGTFNHEATIDAMESAMGIVKQILASPSVEEHMYIDYQGNKLNW
ncbi:SDR family oxidoreductase [Evansella sp. AB-rgal1]|uniref:SDR family oxidoreductase n=1 Tax=Evansella sp. AB-rgal1 TaxID=3242696 RepID=UPI00359D734C